MLMKWSLFPKNLTRDNIYELSIILINDSMENYWINRVQIYFPDLDISYSKKINKLLRSPIFGLINRTRKISFNLKLTREFVSPKKFVIILFVKKLIGNQYSREFFINFSPEIFQVTPKPTYRAFISRSIRKEEINIPDYISQQIKKWGFNLYTVGIPPLKNQYSDKELLYTIENQIALSDIVFAIATKRDQLLKSLQWRTFEWLQSETGIAYVLNKQILVFVEKGVNLSGLASKRIILEFDPNNLQEIDEFLDRIMFQIRENIKNRKNTEDLINFLKGFGIIGGILIIGKIAYDLGKDSIVLKENGI